MSALVPPWKTKWKEKEKIAEDETHSFPCSSSTGSSRYYHKGKKLLLGPSGGHEVKVERVLHKSKVLQILHIPQLKKSFVQGRETDGQAKDKTRK